MTSLTKNQQTIQDIFGTHLGRQADTEGLNYWAGQLDANKSVADVIRGTFCLCTTTGYIDTVRCTYGNRQKIRLRRIDIILGQLFEYINKK